MSPHALPPVSLVRPAASPARVAVRHVVAAALNLASHALARLADRLSAGPAAPQVLQPAQLEFHAEAGAPEGALYADGVLVAVLPGVTRL